MEEIKVDLDRNFILYFFAYFAGWPGGVCIWAAFTYPDIPDTNSIYTMFLTILTVEISILAINIILLYRNKVVKMKPNNRKELGDITEYLRVQENYGNGNYEYEIIRKKEDIKKAHKEGKKFVFQEKSEKLKKGILEGIIFSIIGLVLSIVSLIYINFYPANMISFIMFNVSGIGSGIFFFVPNYFKFKRFYKSFIVLDRNGFLKSSIWGILRAYSWNNVDVKVYKVKAFSRWNGYFEYPPTMQIYVTLPKGGILKIDPGKYDLKEFLPLDKITEKLKQNPKINRNERNKLKSSISDLKNYYFELFAFTFQYFFELSKYGKYGFKVLRPNVNCESECYKVWNPNLIQDFEIFLNCLKYQSNFKSSIQGFF